MVEDEPFMLSHSREDIARHEAKRAVQLMCRRCGNLKEPRREYAQLCVMCSEDLIEKAELYGGESWEIGQRLKSYTDKVNEEWQSKLNY